MIFKKRINDKSFRVILFLSAFGFVCDLYGLYTISQHKDNFLTYNLLVLVEGVSLGIFFYEILYKKLMKQLLLVIGFGYISYWLYKFFSIGERYYINKCVTIESICILAFALYYYYEQVIKINTTYIYSQPRFWIVTAYLIYIAGIFFLLLYLPSFSFQDRQKYYVLNYAFVILRTILLSLAMLMKAQHPPTKNNKLRAASTLST